MPVRLTINRDARQGADGYYQTVVGDIGVKVYRKDDPQRAQREFLLQCYASDMTLSAAEPLAYQVLDYPLGKRGAKVYRPTLYMRHIEGENCADHARRLGKEHNATFSEDEADEWGYTSPAFAAVADRIMAVCDNLKSHGFNCYDHEENFGNWMLQQNTGKVYAIDFSVETENEPLLRSIWESNFFRLYVPKISLEQIAMLSQFNTLGLN